MIKYKQRYIFECEYCLKEYKYKFFAKCCEDRCKKRLMNFLEKNIYNYKIEKERITECVWNSTVNVNTRYVKYPHVKWFCRITGRKISVNIWTWYDKALFRNIFKKI